MRKDALGILVAYLAVYLIWGSTYLFIKMAVAGFPPYLMVGVRFTVGGLLLLLFALARGRLRPLPPLRSVLAAMLLGTLFMVGANGLVTVAEQKVDSYLVALVMAAVPLLVAFFDRFLFRKTVSWLRLGGIVVGVIGVILLLYNGSSIQASLSVPTAMIVIAMLIWSFATSLGQSLPLPRDLGVNSGLQMLWAGLVSLAIAFLSGMVPPGFLGGLLQPGAISFRAWFGLGYLAIVGSLGFMAYSYLIVKEPSSRVVSYALVNPGIAVILGLLVGHETLVPLFPYGLALVLLGLFCMLYGEELRRAWRTRRRGRALDRQGRRSGPGGRT
jgi:drug/metabolite transporter (DMT)-like permease